MRLLIINPNSTPGVTRLIDRSARDAMQPGDSFVTVSADSGISLIVTEADQEAAAIAVRDCAAAHLASENGIDGIVIASFGDTGRDAVQAIAPCPVAGIAECAFAAAAQCGGRFAIVSFSEEMRPSFAAILDRYGYDRSAYDIRLLPGQKIADAGRIQDAVFDGLLDLSLAAEREGAAAIVPGGGPLAGLASRMQPRLNIPVIDGVQAAIAFLRQQQAGRGTDGG